MKKILAWAGAMICALALIVLLVHTVTIQNPPIVKTGTLRLTVLEAPDFTMTISPPAILTPPGRTPGAVITIEASPTFAGEIDFTAAGFPEGVTWTFSPSSRMTIGNSETRAVQLNLVVGAGVIVGSYDLAITATSTVYN